MRFQKGQLVYRACLAEFEGGEHPIVILAKVSAVCPRRGEPTTYHLHNFDGLQRAKGQVWATYNAPEDSMFTDPLEAMNAAVRGSNAAAGVTRERCTDAVASPEVGRG